MLRAAINYLGPMDERPRYHSQEHSRDNLKLDPRLVPIIDGRQAPPDLEHEGIELFPHDSAVGDFSTAEGAAAYQAEIETLIRQITGAADAVVMGTLMRFAEGDASFKTGVNSQPARFSHVDFTDVSLPQLLARSPAAPHFRPGRRVAMFNVWRALSEPPQDVPLAVCDAGSVAEEDWARGDAVFDVGEPPWRSAEGYLLRHNPAHRWLYFSDMRANEVLIFKGFDSDPVRPQRVPHCAFDHPDVPDGVPPRISVETRAFCFFD